MGFSYTCAKTHLPVMAVSSDATRDLSNVVVLYRNGEQVVGAYAGEGNVSGHQVDPSSIEQGDIKFVLQRFYSGEKFEDLGPSWKDPGFGYFHNLDKLDAWLDAGGFPSYAAFLAAYGDRTESWLGNCGDTYAVVSTRTPPASEAQQFRFTLTVVPGMVMCRGSMLPGVVHNEDGDFAQLTAFEQEYVTYCINEGRDLKAETEPDEEDEAKFGFVATSTRSAVGQVIVLLNDGNNQTSAYDVAALAKHAGARDLKAFFEACRANDDLLMDTALSYADPICRVTGDSKHARHTLIRELPTGSATVIYPEFF